MNKPTDIALVIAAGLAIFLLGAGCGAPDSTDDSREVTLKNGSAQGGSSDTQASDSQREPDDVAAAQGGADDAVDGDGDGTGSAESGATCEEGYEQCSCSDLPDHGGADEDHGQNQGDSESQGGPPEDEDKGPCCCLIVILAE